VTGRTLAIDQGGVAVRTGLWCAEYFLIALRAVADEIRVAFRADWRGQQELLPAGGTVEKERFIAVGTVVVVIGDRLAAGGTDGLAALVAKAILDVKGDVAVGATAGKGLVGRAPGRNQKEFEAGSLVGLVRIVIFVFRCGAAQVGIVLKGRAAMGADGRVGGHLLVALAAIEAVGGSTRWT
jgi:hypothetical protein